MRGSRLVGAGWILGLAGALAISSPPSASAHVLTATRARADFLEFAYGVAYSYSISRPPVVRCGRAGGNVHSVICDWRFVREATVVDPTPVASCSGRYRLEIRTGSRAIQRSVVRRLTCRPLR